MAVQAKMMKNFILNGYRDINGDEIKDRYMNSFKILRKNLLFIYLFKQMEK